MAQSGRPSAFVEEYFLTNFNRVEAARRAGYEGDYRTLAVTAHRLLKNAKVQKQIEARFDEYGMKSGEIIARITAIAQSDADDFLNEEGDIDIKRLRERGKTQLVKKVKKTKRTFKNRDGSTAFVEETIELEFHDPQSALVTLAKHRKLLAERVELVDWRRELEEKGVSAGDAFNDLVGQIAAHIAAGA